jgi:hypothetical protein
VKKTNKKELALSTEKVRTLVAEGLATAAGGSWYPRTQITPCPAPTVKCGPVTQ